MTRKEAAEKVRAMLSSGSAKRDVFSELSHQGVSECALAWWIASWADPERCQRNRRHIRMLMGITVVLLLLGIGAALLPHGFVSQGMGPVSLFAMGAPVLFALFFLWGFATNRALAYNVCIVLLVVMLTVFAVGCMVTPDDRTLVVLCLKFTVGLALVFYVWFVRGQLFPDFRILVPGRVDGQYVFVERWR